METIQAWLDVGLAEITTIKQYLALATPEMGAIKEINGDEFNHCLVAVLNAAVELGIKIPTDQLGELFDKAFESENNE